MNDHRVVRIAGEDVRTFLGSRRAGLTRDALAAIVAEVPAYGRLPTELIEGDVRHVVQRAISLFIEGVAVRGLVGEEELIVLTDSAERRAEEGVPMEMVVAAYYCGARTCVDAMAAAAQPGDLRDFAEMNRAVIAFLERITVAVAAGYARYGRTTLAEQATSRQLLANALLEGGDGIEAARRAGMTLPTAYVVLAVVAGAHPDESDPAVDTTVAAQRKVRRLREELERNHAEPMLWVPAPDGGLALLPQTSADPEKLDWKRLTAVLHSVERAAGAEVYAGAEIAPPEQVAAAAGLAREVVDVARRTHRPGGIYRLADVALDYQLTRPSAALPVLADLLTPLDVRPELLLALRTFLATGLNRRRSASQIGVHPNTVDNRLKRIAELTGLDPARPTDLPTITAALAARTTV